MVPFFSAVYFLLRRAGRSGSFGSQAVITALIAPRDSGGMTATTDTSVTSGRIYHPYMQRSTDPTTGSRNWAVSRITVITVKVYQR